MENNRLVPTDDED